MKKIIAFLVLISSVLLLASCNDDPKINVVSYEATSNSLMFTVECKNTKKVEANTINLYLYKNYGKTGQKQIGAIGIYNYYDTREFTDLEPDTVYDLRITCTFDGELGHEVAVLQYQTAPITSKSISNVESFKDMSSDLSSTALYELSSDIDFENQTIEPITNTAKDNFKGTFDGNGKTIKNLTISTTDTSIGMFRGLEGIVKNLTIENLTIDVTLKTSSEISIGAVAGYSSGLIENVQIKNLKINFIDNYQSSTDKTAVGGIVGNAQASQKSDDTETAIRNCSVEGEITVKAEYANAVVGGLVGSTEHSSGYQEKTYIENSKSDVVINATSKYKASIGGIIADMDNKVEMTDCYSKSNITLTDISKGTLNKSHKQSVGGIAGTSASGSITNVVADTTIVLNSNSNASAVNVGSFIGYSYEDVKIKSSLAEGDITVNIESTREENTVTVSNFIGLFSVSTTKKVSNSYSNSVAKINTNTNDVISTVDVEFDVTKENAVNVETFTASQELMTSLEFSDLWELKNNKIVLK